MIRSIVFATFILTILVLFSCVPKNEYIITALGSKQNLRIVTSKVYGSASGFCSNSLYLNSDSTFLNEAGCEGRSHITVGTWKIVSDSIELRAIDWSELTLIANVELFRDNKSRSTTFLITDKRNKPISGFIILPMNKNKKYHFTSNPSIVIDTNGTRVYCPQTNAYGEVLIEKAVFDSVIFPQLEIISKKKFRFPSQNLPDTIKISLDIVDFGFSYPEVTYDFWNKPAKLRLAKDGLINADHELKLIK